MRNPMSAAADHAKPQRAEPMVKHPIANKKALRAPNRSTTHPVKGITIASAKRYPVVTH